MRVQFFPQGGTCLAALAVVVLACTDPRSHVPPLEPVATYEGEDDCETQIIPTPECDDSGHVTGVEYEAYLDSAVVDTYLQGGYTEPSDWLCPRSRTTNTTAIVRDPLTHYDYEFNVYGTWIIDWVKSAILLPSGQAIYNWPRNPHRGDGYWQGWNTSTYAPSFIYVHSARAICHNGLHIVRFYGVRVRDTGMQQDNTGGGTLVSFNGGGGGNCQVEYLIVEVNDGSGWRVLWEGYATVCS